MTDLKRVLDAELEIARQESRTAELEKALRWQLENCEENTCTKDMHTTCWWCARGWLVLQGADHNDQD